MHSPKKLFAALSLLFPLPLLSSLFLSTLFAGPAYAQLHAQPPIAVSGPYTLTLPMIKDDFAVTAFAARRPLSTAEQVQITMIDMTQFRRNPAWSCQFLRREAADLKSLRRMDPVRLAEWREATITNAYFQPKNSLVTPEENRTYLAIYTHANPIVSADQASGIVVTESDMTAWQAAARLAATQTHSPMTWTRAAMLKVLQDPRLPKHIREDASHMERNWIIYRLGWAHEPASDRRSALASLTQIVRRFTAQGRPAIGLGGAALHMGALAYGDYPYLMDPRFAFLKPKILAQILVKGQAMNTMIMDQAIRENGRLMRNGVQERGGLAPHAGDEIPAPFHYPVMP